MVNVAGRSKGCHTCRRRRIKCDERKPLCHRCEKAGHACEGYAKITQFINTSTAPFKIEDANITTSQGTDLRLSLRPKVPDEFSLVAFKEDICMSFVFENFVWRTYGTPWLEEAASGKVDDLSLHACRAIAKLNFGTFHHQKDIELAGSALYGQVLNATAPRLAVGISAGRERLILPVLIMLLYSTLAGDRAGTASHAQGLVHLLQACGPAAFQTTHSRSVFESCRATIITMQLIVKKRTFLESEAWREIPWTMSVNSKSIQNHITDVMTTIPGFLQDAEHYALSKSLDQKQSLLSRVQAQLSRLYSIRWQWEKVYSTTISEVARPRTGATSSHRKHRDCERELRFQDPLQSNEIMIYNTALLWLLSLLWRLNGSNVSSIVKSAAESTCLFDLPRSSLLFRPGETCTLRAPAVEICRCYEYQTRHASKVKTSALFYLLPLALAGTVLKDEPLYSVWIRDMLEQSAATRGYGIDQSNVYGFRFYLTPESLQLQS